MLTPDTVLENRYRIVRRLAEGGMGTVYEAEALRLNTTVALKETHFTDERLRKQFEREAHLLAALRHPALPRVIDHFDEGGGLYLVMDYVEGDDLWEMFQKRGGAFPVGEVLDWADQLLDALAYIHEREPPVIHRDIKPQNLKLAAGGRIVLLDFGLAKGFAGQVSRVTTSGSIFGYTPSYAPLEQIQGTGTDARSDLYSLAATLYLLMTGKVPPDVLTRLADTTDGRPDPLLPADELNRRVPKPVAGVLAKAMEVGRSRRYANAAEMHDALKGAGGETETITALSPTVTESAEDEQKEEPLPSETTVVSENKKTPTVWRVPAAPPTPIREMLDDEPGDVARIEEPVVAININQQYPQSKSAEELYHATRGIWRLNRQRAERARYAFAVYQGVIKEVYKIHRWMSARRETIEYWDERSKAQGKYFPSEVNEGRSEFVGELAPEEIRKKYIGRRLPVRHSQNPIRYFNC
jgi:serine/threonine protein kinase